MEGSDGGFNLGEKLAPGLDEEEIFPIVAPSDAKSFGAPVPASPIYPEAGTPEFANKTGWSTVKSPRPEARPPAPVRSGRRRTVTTRKGTEANIA